MPFTELTPGGEYGRTVFVSVGPRDGGDAKTWASDTVQSVASGVPPTLVTGLRIGFEVKRDTASEPSQGAVKLYNLSTSSRAWLQAEGLQVRLEGGYGASVRSLFTADIADVWHEKTGTDWITTIEGGDGEGGYRDGTVNFSGGPGITRRRVFDELARVLGYPLGYVAQIANTAYRSGVTLWGDARTHLDDLTEELGLRWSIQDGALQVLEEGQSTTEEAFRISAESGLIGRSTLRRTDDGKEGIALKVRLNGLIVPGRALVMNDGDVRGTYVAEKVTHKGDSGYSADYVSEIEGTVAK